MDDVYVFDAHAVVWYLEGNARLGSRAKAILDGLGSTFILPSIALAEAAIVVERGRTGIPSVDELFDLLRADGRFTVAPLTWELLEDWPNLTAIPEMHDRIIVATARRYQGRANVVTLVTRDVEIARSGLVLTAW